ncbi:hypothetical protein RhiirA4_487568 [Rhizophagus irregularis]|uniref:Uncharacterized protein n=1 Tax=Rhizophagus irregularis TaxID=588596 RepID=A0A2I1HSS3_9GLOM|nr:hypothetical protein RhiirA4_487568 [Rhizophagus irregularis]
MIQYKINLTKEELEKYLKGKEKIELDICDENDKIIEKKVISKNMKNKVVMRKRKRNDEEIEEERQEMKKLRKEDKVERFKNELELPIKDNKEILLEESAGMTQNEEIEDVKRLVEKYLDLGDMNSGIIQKYYYLGQRFERKVVEKKNQEKEKSDQTIRKELYDEMMKFLVEKEENDREKKDKRKALKEKIRGAVIIYELFIKIGQERINNVKETAVRTIIKLTTSQKN